jgi:DNA-binding NtrC family response regulator
MLNPESLSDTPVLIDPASKAFQSLLDKLAPTEATVLIVGETGTGKEVVARYLHHHSTRRHQPFLAVNCGALTESLAEAELFGHEKGAFTGAVQSHPGWFEAAEGGTLLLDEIGELSLPLQVKLLRVLQEREITRVGSRKAIKVNVRVIAATHVDLAQAIRERRFREDLYYRLNIAIVPLPPLRQRRQDIPQLANHFLTLYARRLGRPTRRLAPETLARLMDYPWPGNIRELENTLHNAVLLSKEEEITPAQLRLSTLHDTPATATDNELDSFIYQQLNQPGEALWERITGALIRGAMAHCDDNQSQAAALLGISRHTLRTQLANIGLIKSRRRVETTPRPLSGAVSADRELRIGYQRFGNLGILKARQSLESAFAHLGVSVLWSEFPPDHSCCTPSPATKSILAPPAKRRRSLPSPATASWCTWRGNRPRRRASRWLSRNIARSAQLPTCAGSVLR